ncbi:MAG: hypothetical protein LBT29_07860 [Flavobacteriaceae bacterium]|jgi:hypothetical protein|nr:hypothetical protein [Flavobacteriaceae bacterium]
MKKTLIFAMLIGMMSFAFAGNGKVQFASKTMATISLLGTYDIKILSVDIISDNDAPGPTSYTCTVTVKVGGNSCTSVGVGNTLDAACDSAYLQSLLCFVANG